MLHEDGVNFVMRPTLPLPLLVTLQVAKAAAGYQVAIITAISSAALDITSPRRVFTLVHVFIKPPQFEPRFSALRLRIEKTASCAHPHKRSISVAILY